MSDGLEQAEKLLKEADEMGCAIPTPLIVELYNMASASKKSDVLLKALQGIYISGFVQGMLQTQKRNAIESLEKEINKNAPH